MSPLATSFAQEEPKLTMSKNTASLAYRSGDSSGALARNDIEIAVELSANCMTEEDQRQKIEVVENL